ncbi:MAG: response regulator, partial [Acetobacteraceae bacterium]|nr:response regulator [Acetobacteraceae bacterium]
AGVEAPAPAAAPGAAAAMRPLSILLVEDDPGIATLVAQLLEAMGHGVRHLQGAKAALAALEEGIRPDIVVTDVLMPGGMSGLELAARLREGWPGLPVVLTTGYADRLEDIAATGLPVLRKPFAADELDAAIRAVMRETA